MIISRTFSFASINFLSSKKTQDKLWYSKKLETKEAEVVQLAKAIVNEPKELVVRSEPTYYDADQSSPNVARNIAHKIIESEKKIPIDKKRDDSRAIAKKILSELPEAPTTCCMSGCANCVWVEYAEKLSQYYKDGGAKAVQEIEEQVTDENIKSFILHELRMRQQNKGTEEEEE